MYKRQGLQFLGVHKELLVQLLIELIEDQAALGGDQRGIRVGIFLIADIHDGLAFLVYAVQHADKILLIVAVVAVAFGNLRPHRLKMCIRDRPFFVVDLLENQCYAVMTALLWLDLQRRDMAECHTLLCCSSTVCSDSQKQSSLTRRCGTC